MHRCVIYVTCVASMTIGDAVLGAFVAYYKLKLRFISTTEASTAVPSMHSGIKSWAFGYTSSVL